MCEEAIFNPRTLVPRNCDTLRPSLQLVDCDSEALQADSAALQEDSEGPHAQPEDAEAVQEESQPAAE